MVSRAGRVLESSQQHFECTLQGEQSVGRSLQQTSILDRSPPTSEGRFSPVLCQRVFGFLSPSSLVLLGGVVLRDPRFSPRDFFIQFLRE